MSNNIKPQLESEAAKIVEAHRLGGGEVRDILCKHALDKGYGENVVRTLSSLVNRHAFKQAMEKDRTDDIQVVDANSILYEMKKCAFQTKAASETPTPHKQAGFGLSGMLNVNAQVGSQQTFANPYTTRVAPTVIAKLAARDRELESTGKALNAGFREDLWAMTKAAEALKRVGFESTAEFTAKLAGYRDDVADLIRLAIEKSPFQKWAMDEHKQRMFVRESLQNLDPMAKRAALALDKMEKLADVQARRATIQQQISELKTRG
jgi:hypothetical protein